MHNKDNTKEYTDDIHPDKHDNKYIYNSERVRDLLKWLADTTTENQYLIMGNINPSKYKKFMRADQARLQALAAAIDGVRAALELTGRKNRHVDLAELDRIHSLRIRAVKQSKIRRSPKREKVALHSGLIRKLFDEGCSLRQAAEYLGRFAGLRINHAYLRQCCLELGIPLGQEGKNAY